MPTLGARTAARMKALARLEQIERERLAILSEFPELQGRRSARRRPAPVTKLRPMHVLLNRPIRRHD
jgi:hypothetical protein